MKIKIGNRTYEVNLGDYEGLLANAPNDSYGCIDYTRSKIVVSTEIAKDFQKEILLHETLHGIMDDAHMNKIVQDENLLEDFIAALAPRLIQVLTDNPTLIEFLTQTNQEPNS